MGSFLKNNRGFTLTELMFAAVISALAIGSLVTVWTFTFRTWAIENERMNVRVDMLKALETIKSDLRLSSLSYTSFYPENSSTYTAISLPVAETGSDGLYSLDSDGKILWDKTVIYHLFTNADASITLRRTVFDPRNNSMDQSDRFNQLSSVVSAGVGTSNSTTDKDFLKNVDIFDITSMAPVIDFYDSSSSAVRVGKVTLGWVELTPGAHTIRFEIAGKNSASAGYDIGVDNIMIEPSGSVREMEYYNSAYAPAGAFTASGLVCRVYDSLWDNDNYLELCGSVGSYMEIIDYYDLWRESSFDNAALANVEKIDEEVRVALDVFAEGESGEVTWFAYAEAGESQQQGRNGTLPGAPAPPFTIRTVVSQDNIDTEGDFIRVSFSSSTLNPLTINSAYITKRNGTTGANGLANQDPGALSVEEYHRHQQLFFKDISGNVTAGTTITTGSEVWSVWTAFPFRGDSDYLISVHIDEVSTVDYKYFQGTAGADRTYYILGGGYAKAGTPDWSAEIVQAPLQNIYINTRIDTWTKTGTVESQIFDTSLSAPAYNQIKWSEYNPAGTGISFKARSCSDKYMMGATGWDLIIGSGNNPGALSISSLRYIQFMAELTSTAYWKTSGETFAYEDYVEEQALGYPVYNFPVDAIGDIFISGVYSTWIDDVEIDWPGTKRLTALTAYVAKRNDYGQAKVLVDGQELINVLSLHVKISTTLSGKTISEENYVEIEPRNTGN